mmetsp:Transcript_35190/g.49236  ORF Transcript_35190/g.49236 Transcript_35190/m.49236 type:complete len:242 (-) Transcript_35190:118-843(-)
MIIRIPSGHDLLRSSSTSESPMIGRTDTPTSFIDGGIPNVNPFFSGRDIHPRFRRYSKNYEVPELLDGWNPSFASLCDAGESHSTTAMIEQEDNKDFDMDAISPTLDSIRQASNNSEKLATKNVNMKLEEQDLNNEQEWMHGENENGLVINEAKRQKRRTYRIAACGHENNIGRKTCWYPGCGAKIKPSMTMAAMAKREWRRRKKMKDRGFFTGSKMSKNKNYTRDEAELLAHCKRVYRLL